MNTRFLLLIIFIFILHVTVEAQTCVNSTVFMETVPLCAKYLRNKNIQEQLVFVPVDLPSVIQALTDAGYEASRSIAFLPTECKRYMYPFVCRSVFPPCANITGVIYKRPFRESVCHKVRQHCKGFVPNENLPNCTSGQFINATSIPVMINNQTYNLMTVRTEETNPPAFPFTCPYPMVNYPRNNMPPEDEWPFPWPCGLRCPTWIYTQNHNDYQKFWNFRFMYIRIITIITNCIDVIIMIGLYISRKYWFQWPRILLTILMIISFLSELSFTLVAVVPDGTVGCRNEYTMNDTYNPLCFFTGLFTQLLYSMLTVYMIIIINIGILVITNDNKKIQLAMKIITVSAIFIPHLVLIPYILATNGYSGNINCFYTNINVITPTLYIFLVLVCFGFVGAVFDVIIICTRAGFNKLKKQTKIILFSLIFGSVYIINTVIGLNDLVNKDKEIKAVEKFLTCKISNWVASVNPSTAMNRIGCHLELHVVKNSHLYYSLGCLLTSIAFLWIFRKSILTGLVQSEEYKTFMSKFSSTRSSSYKNSDNSGQKTPV